MGWAFRQRSRWGGGQLNRRKGMRCYVGRSDREEARHRSANFKFYRQATNKIVGISDKAAAFLGECF
jgi:hypothetical protein